jgi:segregation and condensation protein B
MERLVGSLTTDCLLEALLFVADGPVPLADLAQAMECDSNAVDDAIIKLTRALADRGLCLARVGSAVQMVTSPDASAAIERFLGSGGHARLSPAAMETLAVIAYRQPITRAQIEAIRGVNSDGVLRTLLSRSLVAPAGRLEQAGRPILFGTTFEFLQYLGLRSLKDLPRPPDEKSGVSSSVES